MRLISFCNGAVLCVAGLAACATAPPTGSPSLAESVSPLSGGPTAAAASAPQVNPKYLTKGYRARVRGRVVLYCRSDVPTASNIRSETCRTAEQLEREAATTRAVIEAMQEQRGNRAPPPPRRN